MSTLISILAVLLSLTSLVLSIMTTRNRQRHQRSGDNSVQAQVGHRDESDWW